MSGSTKVTQAASTIGDEILKASNLAARMTRHGASLPPDADRQSASAYSCRRAYGDQATLEGSHLASTRSALTDECLQGRVGAERLRTCGRATGGGRDERDAGGARGRRTRRATQRKRTLAFFPQRLRILDKAKKTWEK